MSSQAGAQDANTAGWSKRALRRALLASVAVNLMGIGLIAGAIMASGPPRKAHTEFGLKSFARTLPADRAAVLRQAYEVRRTQVWDLRDVARAARTEATEALVAPAYDKPKLREALLRIDDAETKLRTLASEILLDGAEKLTPQERKDFADWWRMRQPLHMRHDRQGQAPPNTAAPPAAANN